MSNNFENKDYAEYFLKLEKSLQNSAETKTEYKKDNESPQKTGTFGSVINLRRFYKPMAAILVLVVIAVAVSVLSSTTGKKNSASQPQESQTNDTQEIQVQKPLLFAEFDANTAAIDADIDSGNIIIVNLDTNRVTAERNSRERCYPASTTKIMTLLVAQENIQNFDDTFTMTYDITDPLYVQGATVAGFTPGEQINMTDLLYGAVLPSGADACMALAQKISGSEENFVKLMNAKAQELGLRDTHFVNSSGLFDENHYTTAEDMAVILRAAMQNEQCRKILSTYQYTTAPTPQHPEGLLLTSTLFSYMYGTEPEGSDILGGKTGFVDESGYCIATFGKSETGSEYICVTLKGAGLWPTVYDQIDLFSRYVK